MTALAISPTPRPNPMAAASLALVGVTPRVGTPRRAAILTALAAAAVREGNLRAVLILARTGRPRSLIRCAGPFRWLALAGLQAVYPEAATEALKAALGCRTPTGRQMHEPARQRAALAKQQGWAPEAVAAVAQAVIENEDAELTARWIWPTACAVAADHTQADAAAVTQVTGERAFPPRAVGQARKLAVYLTMTEGDVNATAMAAATGLDKKTVRHHATTIEDARDEDGALDAALETLAAELRRRLDEELSQW